jgi:multidrug resistance efflux pump
MNTTRRPNRFFWLLGLVLLVGTAAGAGWVLNHAPAQTSTSQKGDPNRWVPGADSIICVGYVDVPNGTTPLYPLQPGRVVEVRVNEGDEVKRGQLLFRMDDRLARAQLKEAQADLKAAEADLAKVEQARKIHAAKVDAQKLAVEAAQALARAQAREAAYQRKMYKAKGQVSLEQLQASEAKQEAAEKKAKAEEKQLRALKEFDFTPELQKARANIEAKKAVEAKALLAVQECEVFAPADGSALRVLVNPGQTLNHDARLPAVQFCPAVPRIVRAEVQQEWGGRVAVGQQVVLEDNTRAGQQWRGRVQRVSDWYAERRAKLQEPFQFNDVRTLECLVSVDPGQPPLRIGQRMRVIIKQGGP